MGMPVKFQGEQSIGNCRGKDWKSTFVDCLLDPCDAFEINWRRACKLLCKAASLNNNRSWLFMTGERGWAGRR